MKSRHTRLSRSSFWCDWASEVAQLYPAHGHTYCDRCRAQVGFSEEPYLATKQLPPGGVKIEAAT